MAESPIKTSWYHNKLLKWILPMATVFLIVVHWSITDIHSGQLLFQVNKLAEIPVFETRYLYFYAHLFALIPVLALSFDKKVAFYKEWKFLLPALFIVAIPYWIWDIAKTAAEVWGFNPRYYTFLLINLPIEEWLFFISFPFASVFIYCCLNAWLPETRFLKWLYKTEKVITFFFILVFFVIGLLNWGKAYTLTTFWIAAFMLAWQFLYGTSTVRILFYRLLPIATFAFIVVNSVFTGAFTDQPIVVYNPEEYLGIRFFSIPLDDFSYNFGLELAVICLFEWFKNKRY